VRPTQDPPPPPGTPPPPGSVSVCIQACPSPAKTFHPCGVTPVRVALHLCPWGFFLLVLTVWKYGCPLATSFLKRGSLFFSVIRGRYDGTKSCGRLLNQLATIQSGASSLSVDCGLPKGFFWTSRGFFLVGATSLPPYPTVIPCGLRFDPRAPPLFLSSGLEGRFSLCSCSHRFCPFVDEDSGVPRKLTNELFTAPFCSITVTF